MARNKIIAHKIIRSEAWANSADIYSGVLIVSDKIHIWLVPDSFSGNHQHSGWWGRKQAFGASSATDIHTNGSWTSTFTQSDLFCFLLCEESTYFQTRRLSLPSFTLNNSVVCSQNLSVPHQPTSASSLHRWITRGSLVGSLSVSSFP